MDAVSSAVASAAGKRLPFSQRGIPWTLHLSNGMHGLDGEEVVVEGLRVGHSASDHRDRVGREPGRIHRIDTSPDSQIPGIHPQPSPERSKGHRRHPGTDLSSGKAWSSQDQSNRQLTVFQRTMEKVAVVASGSAIPSPLVCCILGNGWSEGSCGQAQTDRVRPEQPGSVPGVFLTNGLTSLPGHDAHCESVMAH